MDKKNIAILVLIVLIIFLIGYVGAIKLNQRQQLIYEEGVGFGQLLEQRNAISQLQNNGFYIISFLDGKNETQIIRLGVIQQRASVEQEKE